MARRRKNAGHESPPNREAFDLNGLYQYGKKPYIGRMTRLSLRAESPMTAPKNRHDVKHVRSLKEAILLEIGLAIEAQDLTDEAASEVVGERLETMKNTIRGRQASYDIIRLMRALARLGVPVSLSVTPASTMLRTGERKTVIRYREPAKARQ